MRTLLFIIAGVVVLLLAAIAIVPQFIPSEVYQRQIEAGAEAALGRDVTVEGPVKIAVFPRVEARASGVTIANPAGFSSPVFAEMDEMRAGLALFPLITRKVEVSEFVLAGPTINLETLADGRVNWEFETGDGAGGAGSAQTPGEPFKRRPELVMGDIALGDVRIVDGSASVIDRVAGESHELSDLNIAVSLPSLAKPLQVDGSLVLDGEPVDLDVRVDTLKAFLSGEEAPFRASIKSDLFTVDADGQFEAGEAVAFSGDMNLAVPSLRSLATFAGAELPPGEVYESFSVRGRATGGETSIAFEDARVEFDDIRADGAFQADISGAKPVLSGTLNVGALDVTPYMPPAPEESGGGGGDGASGVPPWSEEPIDVAALSMVDATFDMSVDSIKVDNIEIGRSAVRAVLRDGRLQADLTELAAYDGGGSAQVIIDASGRTPSFALSADLGGVQAQPLLAAAAGFNRVGGAGGLQVSLSGSGSSVAELMRDLDGDGSFAFEDGKLQGVNLGAVARGVQAALQGQLPTEAFSSAASTDFSELGASFSMIDGVARTNDFSVLSPLVRVTGGGALDLGGQTVDFQMIPRVVASAEGQGGDSGLSGLAAPVAISGGWGSVKIGLDTAGLREAAAAEARAQVTDEVSDLINDNLGDSAAGDLVRGFLGGGSEDAEGAEDGEEDDGDLTDALVEELGRNLFNRD